MQSRYLVSGMYLPREAAGSFPYGLFTGLGLAGLAYFLSGLFLLHLAEPETHPLHWLMSEYGWTGHGWLFNQSLLALSVGFLCFCFAFIRLRHRSVLSWISFALFLIAGLSLAGVAFEPLGHPDSDARNYEMHNVMAITCFFTVTLGLIVGSLSFLTDRAWRDMVPLALLISLVNGWMFFRIGYAAVYEDGLYQGLWERISTGLILLWMTLCTLRIRRIASRNRRMIQT